MECHVIPHLFGKNIIPRINSRRNAFKLNAKHCLKQQISGAKITRQLNLKRFQKEFATD
jgi:hypothetical protein